MIGLEGKTTLYRHWDADGALLYVGISYIEKARREAHRRSCWWSLVHAITTETYPSRAEALSAEARAIRDESPLYNLAGAPKEQYERALTLRAERKHERAVASAYGKVERGWSDDALQAMYSDCCARCDVTPQWLARSSTSARQPFHKWHALCSQHAISAWIYAPSASDRVTLVHYAGDMWLKPHPGLHYLSRRAVAA